MFSGGGGASGASGGGPAERSETERWSCFIKPDNAA